MRVGLFSNAYRPVVSGVVNSLDEIRKGLLQRNHTPFLFAPDVKGYAEPHAGVFRFPSVDVDPSVGFPFPIPFSPRLSRLIPKMRLDLIHSHHPILVGAAAANYARRMQVPLVYTFHTQIEQYTHYVPFFSHETVRDAARAKVRRYLNKSDLVICPSPSIRPMIESYGACTRIETLPNAIDIEKFLNTDRSVGKLRENLGLTADSLLSLSVGRLAEEKGLPFLFRAFAGSVDNEKHHLVVVGSGPQKEELKALATGLGLIHRIHFLGAVPYSKMPELYAQSDIFVICSTTEVKPLVVLEALASGLPILAVAACGTEDTIQHKLDGLLCELDSGRYATLWDTLIKDQDLRTKLGMAGRRTATQYSIDGYLDRLCQLYSETLGNFRPDARRHSGTG